MSPNDLENVLRKIGLKKVTDRNSDIMACCPNPNHHDNNPSWGVSKSEPHLHGCFSCGYKGTLFNLLTDIGGYSIEQAAALCDIRVGYKGEYRKLPTFSTGSENKKELSPLEKSVLYPFTFDDNVVDYMVNKRGIELTTCMKTGLLYDRMQRRIIFPWFWGELLTGVTGRAIDDNPYKMLPYNETKKGGTFYLPSRNLRSDKPLVLVEGEIDALKVYQAGFTNVAAIGFGRFTDTHKNLLIDSGVYDIVCFFDADPTGHHLTKFVSKRMGKVANVKSVDYSPFYKGEKLDPAKLNVKKLRFLLNHCVEETKKLALYSVDVNQA